MRERARREVNSSLTLWGPGNGGPQRAPQCAPPSGEAHPFIHHDWLLGRNWQHHKLPRLRPVGHSWMTLNCSPNCAIAWEGCPLGRQWTWPDKWPHWSTVGHWRRKEGPCLKRRRQDAGGSGVAVRLEYKKPVSPLRGTSCRERSVMKVPFQTQTGLVYMPASPETLNHGVPLCPF